MNLYSLLKNNDITKSKWRIDTRMKKILFLSSRLPNPIDDGRSLTLKQYLDMLSKHFQVAVVSLKGKKDPSNQPQYLDFIKEIPYPSFVEKIKNVLCLSLFRGYPLQVSGVYSKKSQKIFNQIVEEYQPDIIICDMIRTSRYIQKCKYDKAMRILDMDDMLSKRYMNSLKTKEDPLGQFRDMLPPLFLKLISIFHLNKFILKFEAKRMKKSEIKDVKNFDKVILVSPLETKRLNELANTNKVVTWPVCIDSIEEEAHVEFNKNQIAFLGNLDVSQNQSTLKYICENILPLLEDNYYILAIGKCSESSKELFKDYSRVQFTGYVDDIKRCLQKSFCLLAPIQYGSGIKIKILQSMGFSLPVVTSPIGVEGLYVTDQKEILIANTSEEYVEKITWLQNEENRQNIIQEGIKYLKTNHSFQLGEQIMIKSLEEDK